MSGKRRVRLAQVARAAGVSVSTASRAINGYADITEQTRQKVLAAAEQLGYRAHATARSLRVGDVRMVAAVVDPESLHPAPGKLSHFWSIMLAELTSQLSERGYGLLTVMNEQAPTLLQQLPYDAVLVLTTRVDISAIVKAVPFGVAMVTATGQDQPDRKHASVGHDYPAAARAVFDHLREAGSEQPALLVPDLQHTFALGLVDGASGWSAENGIDVRSYTLNGTLDDLVGTALDDGCDAIFCATADSAEVVAAIRNHGREPGRDILLVVQSDNPVNAYFEPSVSVLAFDPMGTADDVIDALESALSGGTSVVDATFELRPGQSSALRR